MEQELHRLLEERQPLESQTTLCLTGDHGQTEFFRIETLLGAGGTSIVYRATKLSSEEGNVRGLLKEFYPTNVGGTSFRFEDLLQALSITRDKDGSLNLPPELCSRQATRLRTVLQILHRLKQNGELCYFIPYLQLYTGTHGVPYLFTPENVQGITLTDYLQEAYQKPDDDKLLQVLHTLYAVASADNYLCQMDTYLLDIKPENILLVRKTTPSGEKNDTFLMDAAGLFDMESIVQQSELTQKPELPFSAGFTAPELGGAVMLPRYYKVGPASDTYALAATLFYALTGKRTTESDNFETSLREGPFASWLDANLIQNYLLPLFRNALAFEASERMQTPAAFAVCLDQVITLLSNRKNAERVSAEQDLIQKLPEMLTHLLFRWPFHEYAANRDIRVLIAGGSAQAIGQTLDAVVASCHVLGYQLHIAVATSDAESLVWDWYSKIADARNWIDFHGSAPFTPYQWETRLAQLCCDDTPPNVETISKLTHRWEANVVVLLTELEGEGSHLAQLVPAPSEGKRLIVYRALHGKTLFPEEEKDGRVVIHMTPAFCEDRFLDLASQIAFRSHFLYERVQDASHSLRHIRQSYERNAYHYTSSQDTALAVKCKLWSAGVPWTNNPQQDAVQFAEKLQKEPELVGQISWLEHRRWIASKLVKGARPLPPEEFSHLLTSSISENGTSVLRKDENGQMHLYHVYLTPSWLDDSRPEGWKTPQQWIIQPLETAIPPELDPLDRACVELSRFYRRRAEEMEPRSSKDVLKKRLKQLQNSLEQHRPDLAEHLSFLSKNIENAVERLECQEGNTAVSKSAYETSCLMLTGLFDELERQEVGDYLRLQQARHALEDLKGEFFARLQSVRDIDAKQYDITLVKNMDFLLCGGGFVMGKLLSVENLLDNIRPLENFLPQKVVYAAYAASQREAAAFAALYENLCRYAELRQLDLPMELRLFAAPGVERPICTHSLIWIDTQNRLANIFPEVMQDCTILDETGGQTELITDAAPLGQSGHRALIVWENDHARAVRGVLPPLVLIKKPYEIDSLFALSGAQTSGGDLHANPIYREIFQEYQNILSELGPQAWYAACDVFEKSLQKASGKYFCSPNGPQNTPYECLLKQTDWQTLAPFFQSLEEENFITNLTVFPIEELLRLRCRTTEEVATGLRYLVDAVQRNFYRIRSYRRSSVGNRNFQVTGEPNQIKLPEVSPDTLEVYRRLAARGWMQWEEDNRIIRDVLPELSIMLRKYGSTLETEIFLQLVQSGLFDECKANCFYRWNGPDSPLNELDVVAVHGERLLLVSCKACRELDASMAYEIEIEARKLHVGAIPVLVASELQPEDQQAFRQRCKALGVLLIDASEVKKMCRAFGRSN